jgi:L-ascorbate metabolism protein UlaG (beta-lactamase superfamily)
MKIKWLGHASFLVISETGTKIITDPYTSGVMGMNYGEIKEAADIVTVSHEHGDHNNVAAVKGEPKVIKEKAPVDIKGIKLSGVSTFHDDSGGSMRGENIIFCFVVDGIRVCHLGDLGHPLTDKQITEIGKPDILLIPVGGNFTIDARVATQVCDKLTPKVIIPMHYKNERCPTFPVAGVDEFIRGKQNVSKSDASELDFTKEKLPTTTQIIVLKPAL